MAKAAPTKKISELLGVITKAPATPANLATERRPAVTTARTATRTMPSGQAGKASLIYFHPEDKKIIRELAAWFAGQGVMINDSLVIKSVLRAARPGGELLAAYQNALQSDQRFKRQQPE
jgi:hypothetical protein